MYSSYSLKPCIEDNILFYEIDHASLTVTFTATTSFHNIYRNIFNDINKRYFLINPNVSMSLYVILYFGRIQNTKFCYCGGMRHHNIGEIRSFVKIKYKMIYCVLFRERILNVSIQVSNTTKKSITFHAITNISR